MNLKKHTWSVLINFFIVTTAISFSGCDSDIKKFSGAARVNNEILSEKELDNIISSSYADEEFKNEVVRKWIERELLFQKAIEDSIIYSENYNKLLENTKKEIASALVLTNYYESNTISYTEKELKEYYRNNISEFILIDEAVHVNMATFIRFEEAVKFRKNVLKSTWKESVELISDSSSVASLENNKLINFYNLIDRNISKAVLSLQVGELSIVLKTEPNRFSVVQLVQKMKAGEIPDLILVKDIVLNRLKVNKRKLLYTELIENLYSKYEVEINK